MGVAHVDREGRARPAWAAPLWLLLLANVLLLLGVCSRYLEAERLREPAVIAWASAVWLTYPWLYVLPAGGMAALLGALLRHHPGAAKWVSLGIACPLLAAVQLAVLADQRLLELYGFHLNGFVWNLVTTRGGIAALGAGPETYGTVALLAVAAVAAEGAVALAATRAACSSRLARRLASPRFVTTLLLAVVALSGFERVAFGASRVEGYRPVLQGEETFPLYQRTSFNHLATRLGFEVARPDGMSATLPGKGLAYPLQPLVFRPDAPRWNVLVLCSESLRADALDPQQMPATWDFAQHALRFQQHISGGNGTRMGVFSIFYGLPGPYWFRFMNQRRGPALLSALQARGYDVWGFTADDFSYPEFDQTVFAEVDHARLHEFGGQGPSWQRDRTMVGEIIDTLDRRDPGRPFFAYAFFESPHARYDFPPETAVFRPYLERFDYVTMDLERDIEAIHNRYRNSVRHLDTQIARVLEALRARNLLSTTLVVITGDHGEEFLESGHWGHNSAFTEAQIRVPLVLSVPGHAPGVVDRMTSHLDIPATLLDALGAESPPESYSLGQSLLGGASRDFTLVSDWLHVAYVDGAAKVVFPMRAASFSRPEVRDRKDRPFARPESFLEAHTAIFARVLAEMGRLSAPL